MVRSETASAKYRASYERAFPRRKATLGRREHSDGTPISFDYAKIAACDHDKHPRVDRGGDETCGGCGLIIACAPSMIEPQLKQICGVNFLETVRRVK